MSTVTIEMEKEFTLEARNLISALLNKGIFDEQGHINYEMSLEEYYMLTDTDTIDEFNPADPFINELFSKHIKVVRNDNTATITYLLSTYEFNYEDEIFLLTLSPILAPYIKQVQSSLV
ncbi:RepB family plasmid replication initiator protein [Viridibacillus arvi]|uniref:RepB family plasmid replication initiator protein n=1 Tax=Viridibacillus arvi TaxID=263475 RepID=UPI0034CDE7A4